jgi:hypothetical protein
MSNSYGGSNAGKAGLRIRETDGSPDVAGVSDIIVSNGSLTDNGNGSVSIDTGGGGGSVSITADNTGTTFVDASVSPSPITGTGTISADLNATGTASSSNYLRGDNTWSNIISGIHTEVVAASTTITSITVSVSTLTSSDSITYSLVNNGVPPLAPQPANPGDGTITSITTGTPGSFDIQVNLQNTDPFLPSSIDVHYQIISQS